MAPGGCARYRESRVFGPDTGAKVREPLKEETASTKRPRRSTRSRERAAGTPASRLIDQQIRDLGGWRGKTLARMRALILAADPEITEEWKWMGTSVWSRHGIVCTGEAYTKVVKLTFARGARIPDPSRLFNASLDGNTRRAIDIHDGEKVDAGAFKALVKSAVAQNGRRRSNVEPEAPCVTSRRPRRADT